MTPADVDAIVREGVAALQRGDAASARSIFERLPDAAPGIEPPWLLLAQACRMTGDFAAEEAAVDRLLAGRPRDIWGLIVKADARARAGDARAASTFYDAALKAAAQLPSIPPELAPHLDRARAAIGSNVGDFERHVGARLTAAGQGALAPRVAEALDIAAGRRQVFLQEPTSFFFPGLPQIAFYEREAFNWVPAVEAAFTAIRAELLAVMAEGREFPAYVETQQNRPSKEHVLIGNPDWGAFHLWREGALVPENAARCPATIAALANAPMPVARARAPMALFSLLKPGTHIPAHNGMLNSRLICHLPLVVPPGCRFRVGNETREWDEGKLLIFDDTIEHEAWNDSAETRVILLFEIWRPEIGETERGQLTTIYEAITDFSA